MTVAIINVDVLWINIFRIMLCSTNVILVIFYILITGDMLGNARFQVLQFQNVKIFYDFTKIA